MKLEELIVYTPSRVPHNFKDLSNTENEYFYIISRAPNSASGGVRWNCQCKICGEYCVKEGSNLKRDKSCGCVKKQNIGKALRKDLSNKKFGKLTAKEYTGKSNSSGNAIWLCECECGAQLEVDSNNLTSLHTTSCGCQKASIGVQNIETLLIDNNILFMKEYSIKNVPGMDNAHPYKFDFAIINKEGYSIRFIEYDGIQHFKETWGVWAKERDSLEAQQQRDRVKNEYALSHNIPLVRIPYWERDNITLDMIMGDQYLVQEVETAIK